MGKETGWERLTSRLFLKKQNEALECRRAKAFGRCFPPPPSDPVRAAGRALEGVPDHPFSTRTAFPFPWEENKLRSSWLDSKAFNCKPRSVDRKEEWRVWANGQQGGQASVPRLPWALRHDRKGFSVLVPQARKRYCCCCYSWTRRAPGSLGLKRIEEGLERETALALCFTTR